MVLKYLMAIIDKITRYLMLDKALVISFRQHQPLNEEGDYGESNGC